ncbi:MAG: hypothetical protein AAFU71_19100 [Cyanobacteria bacterium J06632_22]
MPHSENTSAISVWDNPFLGVWQRQYIQVDDGPKETQQQVLWIQAPQQFVDVRSWPYREPVIAQTYNQLNHRQQFDASLLGFAGHFCWEQIDTQQYRCRWHHHITLLPGSFDDASHCTWLTPDTVIETGSYTDIAGITHPFEECWQRLALSSVKTWQVSERSVGLQCDDWAALVCDRRTAPDDWQNYGATCWQRVGGKWQHQFGTSTSITAYPPNPEPPDNE